MVNSSRRRFIRAIFLLTNRRFIPAIFLLAIALSVHIWWEGDTVSVYMQWEWNGTPVEVRQMPKPTQAPTKSELPPSNMPVGVTPTLKPTLKPTQAPTKYGEWNPFTEDPSIQFVPPLLLRPPQESNGWQSFAEQTTRHNLNAYQASPAIPESQDKSRILHFIFLTEAEESVPFHLMNFLVVRAAYLRLQPYEIYVHLNKDPKDSPYWRLIKPMVQLNRVRSVTEIFGNKVSGLAHMSDILRLEVLQKYGGMYMDIDSLSLRPFPEGMWHPPKGFMVSLENSKTLGVGVIAARNDSIILKEWYESYRTFDDRQWSDHSTYKCTELMHRHPDHVNLVPREYFYSPNYLQIDAIFKPHNDTNDTNVENYARAMAPHFWGTTARRHGYEQRMNVANVLNENSSINQILRALLPHPFFSIFVPCEDKKETMELVESIIKQRFPLWQIVFENARKCQEMILDDIAPKYPKVNSTRFVLSSEEAKVSGVWKVRLDKGKGLNSTELDDVLELMRVERDALNVKSLNRDYSFIFDPSRGISRIKL